jgi:DNA-binding MarR family transcriptional regulator
LTNVKKFAKKMSSMIKDQTAPIGLPGFTFLTNHAHVLVALDGSPDARVRDLAVKVGITERAVQRIIADLEAVGVLERERTGRRNHYRIKRESHLRHALESHCTVGGLLDWVKQMKA